MKILRWLLLILAFCIGWSGRVGPVMGQSSSSAYQLDVRPDLWYNKIDGIRLGGVVTGKEWSSIDISSHQLRAGIWLGTSLPEDPVSYFVSLKEPITSISSLGNESFIEGISSIRAGYQQHKIKWYKQWRPELGSSNATSLAAALFAARHFDDQYRQFPQLWQSQWISAASLKGTFRRKNRAGRWRLTGESTVNLPFETREFFRFHSELIHQYRFNRYFSVKNRLYFGIATDQTATEYRWLTATASPVHWMDHGWFRARGTIPESWMGSGQVQLVGGPHLRGYTAHTMKQLNSGMSPLYNSIGSYNVEFEFPNPLNTAFSRIPVISQFTHFTSYLFGDVGTSLGLTTNELEEYLADAGMGVRFELNIPDYLHQPRGFFIRYEMPFWVSDPLPGEDAMRVRHLVGFGTVLNL